VICTDRFRGGQAAEERFQVDVHILDDGFQHLALARDVDLLALDATQTISDRHLLPAGRQRNRFPLCGAPRSWCSHARIPRIRNLWKNWC